MLWQVDVDVCKIPAQNLLTKFVFTDIYENKSSFTIIFCFGKLELEDWRTRKLTVRYNDNNSTQSSLYVTTDT